VDGFVVPACRNCGGVLKPDVVFFGESVPRQRVDRAWELFERSASILVAGSSLTVFSGFRFVQRAAKVGKPIAVVNRGATRGDPLTTVRLDGRLAEILPALVENLSSLDP
jgi:NAD-dependent SIR2 family protein deacetylase